MAEPERIKNTEEQIDLAGLLLGVDLSSLPPEEAMKLKRSALHLYRLGHASGFKAGVDHATSAIAAVRKARRVPGGSPRLVGVQNIAALDERNSYQNIHRGVTKWRIRLT